MIHAACGMLRQIYVGNAWTIVTSDGGSGKKAAKQQNNILLRGGDRPPDLYRDTVKALTKHRRGQEPLEMTPRLHDAALH